MNIEQSMENDPLYKEICTEHATKLLAILGKYYGVRSSKRTALYQYTRMSALCDGILGANREKGKEIVLRATSLGYMNDPKEMISGLNVAKFVLQNVSDPTDYPSEIEIQDARNNIFVTCFSRQRDSLPMWNVYGDNGTGVSLLFDAKSLCTAYPEHPFACLYDGGDKILRLLKRWLRVSENSDDILYEHYKKILSSDITPQMAILYTLMVIVKNRYYDYENEVRVTVFDDGPVKYRVANNLLVPYKERFLPKEALHEILIGPCNDPVRSKASLEAYLHSIGLDHVVVNVSDIPYQV